MKIFQQAAKITVRPANKGVANLQTFLYYAGLTYIRTQPAMRPSLLLMSILSFSSLFAQNIEDFDASSMTKLPDLAYKSGNLSSYEKERCKLDLYLPKDEDNFPVLVWLHGGGIKINSKDTLESQVVEMRLASEGIGVAVISYRLSPQAQFPDYVEDIAAATSWVKQHIGLSGWKNAGRTSVNRSQINSIGPAL